MSFITQLVLDAIGCGDYEALKQQNKDLYKLAHYDSLTGLANRNLFNQQSESLLINSIAEGEPMTFFLIDLDNFKMINDTHGHQAGNIVLIEVAKRLHGIAEARCVLAQRLGRYKSGHDCHCTVARLGGDEFVVIFENMDKHEANIIAQQITSELKEVIELDTLEVCISASVGGSIFPWDGGSIHELLKAADLAMYASKERGKDQFAFHEKSMNTKIERRVEAELAVREMITSGNITVYYQPIADTDTGRIAGAEALLRGKKAIDKFFDPMELITAAEDTNLIVPLGTIILRNACRFARECIDRVGEESDMFISVNVSAHQLNDWRFADIVEKTLHECDLPPNHLILEITETMLMRDFENSARILSRLRNIGIRISIDDFGKGYSSFSYLQKLPIDKIKIDMSFIQSLGQDTKANEIVKAIILMADALGMRTCAEGVETETQYNKLVEFGCEQIQGYYKHKALSPVDFVDVITKKVV